ncbi:MAG: lipopolysaccharide biosynthesis protein [Planctomycetota bacterium]|nr:MAG: lipopolysaccharide biosynthesis protein [Planctomycetota bacterium]REJ92691.1 MAG: lipopolysaccharide biosynthesis protein [Planctomycetota bacterium]REK23728.1 MAG: lipopolysaccharide biosynthesis protein [Planctomycetota bacterium]REK47581.1 MAG: lipopolysaccharide biosynthesis protein [Planctomycetota bacterium]
MSSGNATSAAPVAGLNPAGSRVRTDSLATSLVFLFCLSAVQPLVSFGRGVLFCRTLSPADLGAWDLALGFLTLAATVVVIGIPGSFGRYVEQYRQRGQLTIFLRRTTLACAGLTGVALVLLTIAAPQFSSIIFGRPDRALWVYYVAAALGTLIVFGFVVELLTALRLFRVVSGLQLTKSIGFVVLALVLLFAWEAGPPSIIVGHALATLVAVAIALRWLIPAYRHESSDAAEEDDDDDEAVDSRFASEGQHEVAAAGSTSVWTFWAKLMPFAAWIWIANFLSHLFAIIDRYMLVHFSGLESEIALTQVGHYHSSRIVPLLSISFASMLASVLLPHLTKDWERGRRDDVTANLNLAVKLLSLGLTFAGTALLALAPQLFEYGFGGRYDGGLVVLPWTLIYCIWFSIFLLGDLYLCCTERVRLISIALAGGLFVNVVLNLLLLPHFGLLGAVWATAASKAVVLLATFLFARAFGMSFDRGTWICLALPLCLCLGAWPALAVILVFAIGLIASDLILGEDEKRHLLELGRRQLAGVMARHS